MFRRPLWLLATPLVASLLAASCGAAPHAVVTLPAVAPGALRPVAAFEHIADPQQRAAALFEEMNRVLAHPRCANCHPSGDSPLQGSFELHDPPVHRGPDDHGVPGMECSSCHQDHNLELARVPGAPKWALAPRKMAWVGRSPSEICEQIKDVDRNGGKTLAQIVHHLGHDELVAWGWRPGHGREPAPGSQAELVALATAWMQAGAACPPAGATSSDQRRAEVKR